MRERREFVRYDVSNYPEIKAATVHGPIGEKLMTLSLGGAGFWAPAEDFRMKLGERVKVHIQAKSDPEPFEVKGEILYILPHPMEAQIGRFYGIRVDEAYAEQMARAVESIHEQYQLGKIKEA